METLDHEPRIRSIERRIETDHHRDVVARALYEVLDDAIGFGPRGLPTGEDREWLRGAAALPLQQATEIALDALAWGVDRTFRQAPVAVRERFDRSHEFEELGWE